MLRPTLSLLALFSLTLAAPGAINLRDGFEAPLQLGSFAKSKDLRTGVPLWNYFVAQGKVDLDQLVKVQSAVVHGGTQALQIDSQAAGVVQCGLSTRFENADASVKIEFDLYLQPDPHPTEWQVSVGDDQAKGGFIGGFNIEQATGKLQMITPAVPETRSLFKRGAWTHCLLNFDLPSQTYQVEIDGKKVRGKIPFLTESHQVRTFRLTTLGSGSDSAYFDNFSVEGTAPPATPAPAPVVQTKAPPAAAPAAKGPRGVVLAKFWAAPTALSAGGHSQEMDDLRALLSPHGKPSENVEVKNPNLKLYENVNFLEPLSSVLAKLAPPNPITARSKVACPAFPDGCNVTTVSGHWHNDFNRLCIVTDMADQVVSIELVCETASLPPPVGSEFVHGDWHLVDIVQARVKGTKEERIEMFQIDAGSALMIHDKCDHLRYTCQWYVGKPLIHLMLHCAQQQEH